MAHSATERHDGPNIPQKKLQKVLAGELSLKATLPSVLSDEYCTVFARQISLIDSANYEVIVCQKKRIKTIG